MCSVSLNSLIFEDPVNPETLIRDVLILPFHQYFRFFTVMVGDSDLSILG